MRLKDIMPQMQIDADVEADVSMHESGVDGEWWAWLWVRYDSKVFRKQQLARIDFTHGAVYVWQEQAA